MHQGADQEEGGFRRWATLLLGGFLALLGLALVVGGAWLAVLGGSLYYLLAGVGLGAAGLLMAARRPAAVWVYAVVFTTTVAWALWEVGLNGWALVPRVIGPFVLLLIVFAAAPLVSAGRSGRRMAAGGLLASLAFVIVFGGAVAWSARPAAPATLPPARFAMSDPSPLTAGADWPAYGGGDTARRYSPLAQLTPANVGGLQQAWLAHTGDLPSAAAKNKYGAETTPLKIGDSLYLCTPKNMILALDAVSGRVRWKYDPRVSDQWIPYTAACRGLSYFAVPGADPRSPCAARLIEGTIDGRLVAVDVRDGRPCAGFGRNGQVDVKAGMGPVTPGMFAITSPPALVRGVIVTGQQILDGQKNDAPSGAIQGFDAFTGRQLWAWDLGRPGSTAPAAPHETYTRGTPNMWTTASADEALGLVYLPLGNSAVDYWSSDRSPEENQYSTSLVALDVKNGRPVWRFQTVHKDVWDYDLGSQATLVDYPAASGRLVPAIVLPSKQGEIYVLDRRTGQPLTGVEERLAPQGGVEPAQRSPTQPFSRFHTLRRPPLREKDMWGMSPLDQMVCRIQFRMAAYQGVYTPPTTDRRWIEYPGYNGGSDWGSVAVDPSRGVIIANYNDMPNYNRLIPRAQAKKLGWAPRGQARGGDLGSGAEGAGDPQAGTPYAVQVNAGWRMPWTKLLCKQPPYGGLRAIDLQTGRTLWDRAIGDARRNGPFGIASHLPITIGTPNNGGPLVTGGGLVFIAATTDNRFRALDLATGKTVWEVGLPAGGQATPMTYEAGGRQYVVLMTGGHHFMETPVGDQVIAYALPSA